MKAKYEPLRSDGDRSIRVLTESESAVFFTLTPGAALDLGFDLIGAAQEAIDEADE